MPAPPLGICRYQHCVIAPVLSVFTRSKAPVSSAAPALILECLGRCVDLIALVFIIYNGKGESQWDPDTDSVTVVIPTLGLPLALRGGPAEPLLGC